MNRLSRRGSAFLDLFIVLFLIGFLVAISMPQVNCLTEDAKKTKAKQDCDTLCQAIQKYQALEGVAITTLLDLKCKYLTNIDTLKDPWGNSYQIDLDRGCVYSRGPDGQDNLCGGGTASNRDNIRVSWTGPLQLIRANFEVHPGTHDIPDMQYTRGILHLHFNKKVKLARNTFLYKSLLLRIAKPESLPNETSRRRIPDSACPDFAIRLISEEKPESSTTSESELLTSSRLETEAMRIHYGPAITVLDYRDPWGQNYRQNKQTGKLLSGGPDTLINLLDPGDPCNQDNISALPRTADSSTSATDSKRLSDTDHYRWPGQLPESLIYQRNNSHWTADGGVFHTADSMEIVIVLPAGQAEELNPGRQWLNLTGNRFNRDENVNPLFREFDGITPAEASEETVLLEWQLPPATYQTAGNRKRTP